MMLIDNKYEIGQTVYLVTDEEQHARLITAIKICPKESVLYELTKETQSALHYDFEISAEKDLINAI